MSGWLLARGRDAQQTLADVIAAGATTIALAGASSHFAAGDWLFISESDGSESQWLGRVTTVNSSSVTFSRPLAQSKNSGALLWRAAAALATLAEGVLPEKRALATGIATEMARSGDTFAVQVAPSTETLSLALEGLTPIAERAALDWIASALAYGVNPFTLVDDSGALSASRLAAQPIVRERSAGGRRRLILPLVLIGEGIYL